MIALDQVSSAHVCPNVLRELSSEIVPFHIIYYHVDVYSCGSQEFVADQ